MVKPFRFGVQCGGDHDRASWRAAGPQDRGARVRDVVPARPLHRHADGADGRRWRSRPRRRRRCASARSCSTTTTSTRRSSPRRSRRSTGSRTAGSSSGIGAGWMKVDYDALGLPYDPAGVRIDRLEEALAVIKGCVGPGAVQLRGHALHDHRLQRHPEADPAAAPADPRRRRRAAGAAARRPRGRHRRASTRTCAPARSRTTRRRTRSPRWSTRRSGGSARAPAPASTTSSCRSGTSSPRSPTTARRSPRPRRPGFGLEPEAALEAGITCIGTIDEICDQLVAPARAVGRELRRDRRRHLRSVRARRRAARRHLRRGLGCRSGQAVAARRTGPGSRCRGARELVVRFGEEVAGAGEDHEVAVADEHLHDRAGVGRQDLVAVAVQQQQGSRAERGAVLAAGGLRRERDDARAVLAEHDARPAPRPRRRTSGRR